MTNPKHALIVYNPAAKSAAEPALWLGEAVHRLCDQGGYTVTVRQTRADTVPDDLFADVLSVPQLVIAAGGDGTIRQVLEAVARCQPDIPVGIIPAGTGNQLARNLGIYEDNLLKDSLEHALSTIFSGHERRIDMGVMNGQYFVVAAGAGPISDAVIIPGREDKTNWKMLAYAHSMVQTFAMPPVVFKVTTDETSFTVSASGIFVTNVADLGVGKISETADLTDGLLDLCILVPTKFSDYLELGFRFAGGFVGGEAPYYIRKVRSVDIEVVPVRSRLSALQQLGHKVRSLLKGKPDARPPLHREVTAMIDGDAAGTTPMHISVVPHAVKVLVPDQATSSERAVTQELV